MFISAVSSAYASWSYLELLDIVIFFPLFVIEGGCSFEVWASIARRLSLTWHGLHHLSPSLRSSFANTLPQLHFALLAKYHPGLHHTPRSLHRTAIDYWQNHVGSWFCPSSFFSRTHIPPLSTCLWLHRLSGSSPWPLISTHAFSRAWL